MFIGALICWMAWFFVLFSIDPQDAGIIGFAFFYLSLFLALTGTFSTMGFLVRKKIVKNEEAVFHHVKHTFRQGIFVSATVVIALLLLQEKLLTWWNGVLLIILFLVLEGVVFTNRKYSNKDLVT